MSSPNVFTSTNYVHTQNDSKRVVDYFCVVGLPNRLTNADPVNSSEPEPPLFHPDIDEKRVCLDPIVDIVVLNKTLNEVC